VYVVISHRILLDISAKQRTPESIQVPKNNKYTFLLYPSSQTSLTRSHKPFTFSYINLPFLVGQDPKVLTLETIIFSTKLKLIKKTGNLILPTYFPFMYSLAATPTFIIFYEGCQTFSNKELISLVTTDLA